MSYVPKVVKCDYGAVLCFSFVYTRVLRVSLILLDLWSSGFSVATLVWVFCTITQEYTCGSHFVHSLVREVCCLGGNQVASPPNSQANGREILESFSQQLSSSSIARGASTLIAAPKLSFWFHFSSCLFNLTSWSLLFSVLFIAGIWGFHFLVLVLSCVFQMLLFIEPLCRYDRCFPHQLSPS